MERSIVGSHGSFEIERVFGDRTGRVVLYRASSDRYVKVLSAKTVRDLKKEIDSFESSKSAEELLTSKSYDYEERAREAEEKLAKVRELVEGLQDLNCVNGRVSQDEYERFVREVAWAATV